MLETVDLSVRYGSVTAVDHVSLAVQPGQVVGLIGANGAGKTSFIDSVSGFTPLSSGLVSLDGRDISRTPAYRRAKLGLRRTFQQLRLFEDLTVAENLTVAVDEQSALGFLRDLARPRSSGRSIDRALSLTGTLPFRDTFPRQLPAGTRRLIAVARALVAEPAILMLDEPAAGLDSTESQELGRVLRTLAAADIGLLLVEHDTALVMAVCDHVEVIDFGRQIASGPPDAVRNDAAVVAAYLGEPTPAAATGSAADGTSR